MEKRFPKIWDLLLRRKSLRYDILRGGGGTKENSERPTFIGGGWGSTGSRGEKVKDVIEKRGIAKSFEKKKS